MNMKIGALADAIVYGKPFFSNSNLMEKFLVRAPVNPWNVRTFYGVDDHGYTYYPTLRITEGENNPWHPKVQMQ